MKKVLSFMFVSSMFLTSNGFGQGRWYNYVDSILALNSSVSGVAKTSVNIWNDNTSVWGTTGSGTTYFKDTCMSVGLGLNPFFSAWNDPLTFDPTEISLSGWDAYTIDSVKVFGLYNRNYSTPAKMAVVDTLILQFVQGDGAVTSNLFVASIIDSAILSHYGPPAHLTFMLMRYDSINNRAAGGHDSVVIPLITGTYKILLRNTDTNGSNSANGTTYPRPGHADPIISYLVAPGNFVSMSVSFKSGDTAYRPGDTICYSSGATITGYKYGCYSSETVYTSTTPGGTIPAWPPYVYSDLVSGFYNRGADTDWTPYHYFPNWYITNHGGPSVLQFPNIRYHVTCSSCWPIVPRYLNVGRKKDLDKIVISPNPADNELTITFRPVKNNVSVSLSNIFGQVVATQNVNNGTTVFNTARLPSGIYIYNVEANGERTTGQVVINH
jgi:hypothetical protein